MSILAPLEQRTADHLGYRKRWTTAEFDRLVNEGLIREGSAVYLWDGEIIEPMSENPPHINALGNIQDLIKERIGRIEWTVNQDSPIELQDGYKPQPDIAVLRGPRRVYSERIARPADVALAVEVCDTSYSKDSNPFLTKYAEVGIPQYWIVNIPARRIEVYPDPALVDDVWTYRSFQSFGIGEQVPLLPDRDGETIAFEPIPVIDVLRESIKPKDEGNKA